MKLLKLVAKHFKKLSDFTADFTDGLNVIVGENAQGKSTLLQAIEAALFGVTVVPGKKEHIPTWGQNNFSLELHFSAEGGTYVLTRSKSTAKLLRYGLEDNSEELVANGNTPVTAYIEQLLGLTAKDFNLFVQSKQGETSGVLTFGATALNQKVEEYAGVSLIDSVGRRANEIATTQRAIAAANEVDSADLEAAREAAQQSSTALKADASEVESAEAALEAIPPLTATPPAVSSQSLMDQRRLADKKADELKSAQADVTLKAQALSSAEEALLAVGEPVEIEDLEEEVKSAKAARQTAQQTRTAVQGERASADQAQAALVEAQAEAQKAEEAHDPELLASLMQQKEEASAAGKEAGEALAVHGARLQDMRNLKDGATCPTCNSKLTDHDPALLANEIKELEARIAVNQGVAAGSKARLESLDTSINAQQSAAARLQQCQLRLARAKAAVEAIRPGINDELAAASETLEQAEGRLARAKTALEAAEGVHERYSAAARRRDKASQALDSAEALLKELAGQQPARPSDVEIDTAAQAEAVYRQAERAHESAKAAANSALVLARAELRNAQAASEYADEELARLEAAAAKGLAARELLDKAARLSRFLRDRRQSYLQEIWQAVMGAASRQVATASRGVISRLTNDGGEFCFEEDGVLAPVASASGAQKAFIGSAVRIGLTRALYGSDSLLIFDEPTESMSERNASGLAASLVGASKQLLLITHREQDQGLAANIIQVGA